VDGQTAAGYAADLEGNLRSLLDRAKSGRYQAPPVRRVHIPKGTGSETRPIGIPTFEDKILQRRWRWSWRPSTSRTSWTARTVPAGPLGAPGAGGARQRLMEVRGGWVLEVDIRKFFDALDHRHLQAILVGGYVTASCCD
jgi:retron-type reverse transcriptase